MGRFFLVVVLSRGETVTNVIKERLIIKKSKSNKPKIYPVWKQVKSCCLLAVVKFMKWKGPLWRYKFPNIGITVTKSGRDFKYIDKFIEQNYPKEHIKQSST